MGERGVGGIILRDQGERLSYAPLAYSPLVTIEENRPDDAEKRAKLGAKMCE